MNYNYLISRSKKLINYSHIFCDNHREPKIPVKFSVFLHIIIKKKIIIKNSIGLLMLTFPYFSGNQDANITKPRIQFPSLLFLIFLCFLVNQPEGYKGYSFVYLIFLQTVRCESERRAMAVGTNTAVTAEFRVGFRVPHAVIDSHFFFCECTLKSHCYCFLLGD